LAKIGSKVGQTHINDFLDQTEISAREVPLAELNSLGINVELLTSAWAVEEAVVDLHALRAFYRSQINKFAIELLLETKVSRIERVNFKWEVSTAETKIRSFDAIVRATHGQDEIDSSDSQITNKNYEFHLTKMLEIKSKQDAFGMTVLDGNFISVLPSGFSDNFLVYGPGTSIREKFVGSKPPENWSPKNEKDDETFIEATNHLLNHWFPNFPKNEVVQIRQTIRAVQAGVSQTDRRVTEVQELASNFFDVRSTKIDHVIEAAQFVIDKIVSA
jgi:hypothetical protein